MQSLLPIALQSLFEVQIRTQNKFPSFQYLHIIIRMQSQKEKQEAATKIMNQMLSGSKDSPCAEQAVQMPELALRCAQFFHSLSQYCLYYYKNYNQESSIYKTKLIKKGQKGSKKDKVEQFKKARNQEKKKRQERGQNEPELPKKPLTAYIIYFQDKKPSFAEKYPSLSLSELTKLIAKEWKDLEDSEKKPYLEKAAQDRKRYESEMIEFRQRHQSAKADAPETQKAKSQLNEPIQNEDENGAASALEEQPKNDLSPNQVMSENSHSENGSSNKEQDQSEKNKIEEE